MAKRLVFTLRTKSGSQPTAFDAKKLVCAGYAGRNQDTVKRHIKELSEQGIPAPSKTPVAYILSSKLLTDSTEIQVGSHETSGEVEFVVLFDKQAKYVTVGSDHTDRFLEKSDVQKSKEACPKIVGRDAWPYDELKAHWDKIRLSSSIIESGKKRIYQEGYFEQIMTLESLVKALGMIDAGTVLFCGTIPTKNGSIAYSNRFHMELHDPILNRTIRHEYSVKTPKRSEHQTER